MIKLETNNLYKARDGKLYLTKEIIDDDVYQPAYIKAVNLEERTIETFTLTGNYFAASESDLDLIEHIPNLLVSLL